MREDAESIAALAAALKDPEARVRHEAASGLWSSAKAAEPARAALVVALGDEDPNVAAQAAGGLQALARRDPDNDVKRAAAESLHGMAWGEEQRAAAAPVPGAGEAAGMAVLRARRIAFEPDMYQRALHEGDVEAVRAFLDAGMSAKAPFPNTGTPLYVLLFHPGSCNAAKRPTRAETKAVLQLLLERGADPDLADAHGNVPLMAAASHGCDREVIAHAAESRREGRREELGRAHAVRIGLICAHDGLEELVAAGYRLPADKANACREAYADRPAAQAMIRKAMAKKWRVGEPPRGCGPASASPPPPVSPRLPPVRPFLPRFRRSPAAAARRRLLSFAA